MRYAVFACAVALAVAPVQGQELLRWQWRAGDAWEYQVSRQIRSRVGPSGGSLAPEAIGSDELQTWTLVAGVDEVDPDGNATIEWTVERIRFSADRGDASFDWDSDHPARDPAGVGPLEVQLLRPLVGGRLRGVVTPRGELSALGGIDSLRARFLAQGGEPNLASAFEGAARQMFGERAAPSLFLAGMPSLPEAPVRVGDSWTTTMPATTLAASILQNTDVRATLIDVDTASGERVAGLRLEAAKRVQADDRAGSVFGPSVAEVTTTGSAQFSLERAMLLRSSTETDVVTALNLPAPVFFRRTAFHESARFELMGRAGDSPAPLTLLPDLPVGSAVVGERSHPGGVVEWELGNGVRVLLKADRFDEPRVVLLGMSDGGTSLAAEGDVASARSAIALVTPSGVGDFSGLRLRQALSGTNVSVQPQIGEWGEGVRGMAPSVELETLLQLTYLRATAPRTDDFVSDSWRARRERSLTTDPPTTARTIGDAWSRLIGEDHPWARPLRLDDLGRVEADRSLAFYRERFADVGDMVFSIVGSFDPDELRPLVERYLGALPSAGRRETWRDHGWRLPEGVVSETVRTSADRSSNVRILFHGSVEDASQTEAVRVDALGTALQTRLRRALRASLGQGGYVSVRTFVTDQPYERYALEITFSSEAGAAEAIVSTIFEQVAAFKSEGPSSEEAERARTALRAENARNLRTDTYWSNELSQAALRNDQPTGRILGAAGLIEGIDADSVRDAARRYLHEERYVQLMTSPDPEGAGPDDGWLSPRLMQRRSDLEAEGGYYATRIEGRRSSVGPQYRASFARFPTGSQARWNWGMTEEAFQDRERTLVAQGFTRIWRQEFTDDRGVSRIQGIWIRFVEP